MSFVLAGQATTDTIGVAFTFFLLIPAILTGLIVVAKVAGRGEKRADDDLQGRWGRRRERSDD